MMNSVYLIRSGKPSRIPLHGLQEFRGHFASLVSTRIESDSEFDYYIPWTIHGTFNTYSAGHPHISHGHLNAIYNLPDHNFEKLNVNTLTNPFNSTKCSLHQRCSAHYVLHFHY